MRWPEVERLAAAAPLPPRYEYRALTRGDLPRLVRELADWYPGIAVGTAKRHLDARYYLERACLDGALESDLFVVLFAEGAELAGMLSVEQDRDSEVLYGRVGAVSPVHRGLNLGERFPALMEVMGRAMGAGMIYGLATLSLPHMQEKFERRGWQLAGIMPGFDREMTEQGVVKRVYEAIYAKVLVDERDFARPCLDDMTPSTRRLFELLYPGKSAREMVSSLPEPTRHPAARSRSTD